MVWGEWNDTGRKHSNIFSFFSPFFPRDISLALNNDHYDFTEEILKQIKAQNMEEITHKDASNSVLTSILPVMQISEIIQPSITMKSTCIRKIMKLGLKAFK